MVVHLVGLCACRPPPDIYACTDELLIRIDLVLLEGDDLQQYFVQRTTGSKEAVTYKTTWKRGFRPQIPSARHSIHRIVGLLLVARVALLVWHMIYRVLGTLGPARRM